MINELLIYRNLNQNHAALPPWMRTDFSLKLTRKTATEVAPGLENLSNVIAKRKRGLDHHIRVHHLPELKVVVGWTKILAIARTAAPGQINI